MIFIRKICAIFFAVFLLVPTASQAATLHAGEEYSLKSNEVLNDNLYAAGGSIEIAGIVNGDLMIAGGGIVLSGDVSGDRAIAGGNVTILGDTGGDLRVAGGNVVVTGTIGGDLVAMGGMVTILPETTVGKDVVITGGKVSLQGEVSGSVIIAGDAVSIGANIMGNTEVSSSNKITLDSDALIGGNFTYKAPLESALQKKEGAVVSGQTLFEEGAAKNVEDLHSGLLVFFSMLALLKILAIFVLTLVLVLALPTLSRGVVTRSRSHPWKDLFIGFASFIVLPVIATFLCATLFGAMIGMIVFAGYGIAMILSVAYATLLLGSYVIRFFTKDDSGDLRWTHALLGVFLLGVLVFIPFIGWLVMMYFCFVSFGSLMRFAYEKWEGR